ncbi:MAG: sensor histidine kinase [Lachnospiraceae bacterium]|nr:sensor histidine kinase [Lachnospiraceae bacterium]
MKKSYIANLGVYIGSIILICAMVVSSVPKNVETEDRFFFLLLFPIVIILFFNIYIWCKHHLRKQYMQQVREREYTRLEEQFAQSLQEIKMLKEENETLSKLVHRDNKLIPSMQLAVQQYLSSLHPDNAKELEVTGQRLLEQLNQEMQDRNETLFSITSLKKQLPTTSIPTLDLCLQYMWYKCEAENISLNMTVAENISPLIDTISAKDLQTLLADLLENARIALKNCDKRNILIQIEIDNSVPSLAVWDSASVFPKEVLYHFGKKRYTTHKKDGGSGIGMIAIQEILQRYQASIIIDEKLTEETLYKKKVEISFDNQYAYILHTERSLEEYAYLSRRDNLQIFAE